TIPDGDNRHSRVDETASDRGQHLGRTAWCPSLAVDLMEHQDEPGLATLRGLDPLCDLANRRANRDGLAFQQEWIDCLVVQSVVDAARPQKPRAFDDSDDPMIVVSVGIAEGFDGADQALQVSPREQDFLLDDPSCLSRQSLVGSSVTSDLVPACGQVQNVVDIHVTWELPVVQTPADDVMGARELGLVQDREPMLIAAPPAIVKAQTHGAIREYATHSQMPSPHQHPSFTDERLSGSSPPPHRCDRSSGSPACRSGRSP